MLGNGRGRIPNRLEIASVTAGQRIERNSNLSGLTSAIEIICKITCIYAALFLCVIGGRRTYIQLESD
jgi:hypothetical protein